MLVPLNECKLWLWLCPCQDLASQGQSSGAGAVQAATFADSSKNNA